MTLCSELGRNEVLYLDRLVVGREANAFFSKGTNLVEGLARSAPSVNVGRFSPPAIGLFVIEDT